MNNIYLFDNIFTDCTESSYLFNKVKTFFVINNYNLVDSEALADYIVINTCGVWKDIEDKYISYINGLLSQYGESKKIFVFGCLSGISDTLKKNTNITIIPTKKEVDFDIYFNHNKSINSISTFDINKLSVKNPSNVFGNEKKRFYVNISRGCIHNCSYCVIKRAIGYVSSRPIDNILEDCTNAIKTGYNELVLVSDDAGSYGLDIKTSFDKLFNKICELEGDYKIDINYVEPGIFAKIFPNIKDNFYKVSSITCPIQSYNNRLLELMNRKYTTELFFDLINKFRLYGDKNLKIINHVIYGYPTETFEEFKNNIKYLKICDSNLFNLYSYRVGTKTFNNNEYLNKEEIKARLNIMFKLNKKDNILVDIANIYDK